MSVTTVCNRQPSEGLEIGRCPVFLGLSDGLVVHDLRDHRVRSVNPRVEEWSGSTGTRLVGGDFFELFDAGTRGALRSAFAASDGNPTGEYRLARSSGERWIEVRSEHGEFDGRTVWISTLRDVTEQRRARDRSDEIHAEMQAADLRRSEFIASISHELRTPMSGILGMSSLLLDSKLDVEQREYAETIQQTAETLVGLLNEILDLAKIERGHFEIDRVSYSPRQVAENAVRLLRPSTGGVDLRLEMDAAVPTSTLGDPVRLNQVLVNLVGNALKFTHEGHVTLRVLVVDEDHRHVRTRFEVEDTGIGIEREMLSRIFEPFAQARGSSGSAYGGTGLGLAISHRLVDLMGGRLQAESEIDRGSRFWFDLDLVASTTGTSATEPDSCDVLYVGAATPRRQTFVEALGTAGHKVETCELSSVGLERIRERVSADAPYRMVVVDQQLPDLDGESFGRSVRNRLQAQMELVLVSNGSRPVDPARAERSGFARVVSDPADFGPIDGTDDPDDVPPAPVILVVEDNPVNQKVVCHMLRRMGFAVELAEDGQQGVERLGAGRIDAVLMDCQMPVMDGYQATRAIRALDGDVASTPIVALTANAMDGDREKCLDAGMDDYLSKPAKADQLREMLEKWIPECSTRLAANVSH